MEEIRYLLALAVHRLGGGMRVTEAEWDAFGDDDLKMTLDLPQSGDVVVTVSTNDLPEGVIRRDKYDGTEVTYREGV